jgi:hypothetical protein
MQSLSTEASKRMIAESHLQKNTSTSDPANCVPNDMWSIRIQRVSADFASKGDMITPEEKEEFRRLHEL